MLRSICAAADSFESLVEVVVCLVDGPDFNAGPELIVVGSRLVLPRLTGILGELHALAQQLNAIVVSLYPFGRLAVCQPHGSQLARVVMFRRGS